MDVITELIIELLERRLLSEEDVRRLQGKGIDDWLNGDLHYEIYKQWEAVEDGGDPPFDPRRRNHSGGKPKGPTLALSEVAASIEVRRRGFSDLLAPMLSLSGGGTMDDVVALHALAESDPARLAERLCDAYRLGRPTLNEVWRGLEPISHILPTGRGQALNAIRQMLVWFDSQPRGFRGSSYDWVLANPDVAWFVDASRVRAGILRAHRILLDEHPVVLDRAMVRWRNGRAYFTLSALVTARCAAGDHGLGAVERVHPVWERALPSELDRLFAGKDGLSLDPRAAVELLGLMAQARAGELATTRECLPCVVARAAWHEGLPPGVEVSPHALLEEIRAIDLERATGP